MHWQIVLGVLYVIALMVIPMACIWILNIFGSHPVDPNDSPGLPLRAIWRDKNK